jgi:hypothetical protein
MISWKIGNKFIHINSTTKIIYKTNLEYIYHLKITIMIQILYFKFIVIGFSAFILFFPLIHFFLLLIFILCINISEFFKNNFINRRFNRIN